MKGYITKKKGNKLYYPVIYRGEDKMTKKKDYKWGKGCVKRKEAETELAKMVVKYSENGVPTNEDEKFSFIYEQWLELIVPEIYHSTQSESTAKGYANKHIIPYFGKAKIESITSQDIQKFFFKMRIDKTTIEEGKKVRKKVAPSPATKRKVFSILNSIFESAKTWGYIINNPCSNIELRTPDTPEMEIWSPEETLLFLSIPEVVESIYYLPFLILATTGMRRGEVCGLRWGDYSQSILFIQRGLDTNLKETDLKTKSSRRSVTLMSNVICALDNHKLKQEKISAILDLTPQINGYIITDEKNDVINPHKLSKIFKMLIKENNKKEDSYKLKEIRLHDLRHGFATMMLYSDVNVKIVSEILGHAKTSTTQNIYQAAATKAMQSQAVESLENIIFKKGQEKRQENEKRA